MIKHLAWGLATSLLALGGSAVAGEEQHETGTPQLFSIYNDIVKPSHREQYEAAMRHMISEFTAYQLDPEKIHWKAISGPEIGYLYVMPIERFADLDQAHANWMEALDIIGKENFEEILAPAMEAMERVEAFQVMRMPEHSYVPEHPRLQKEDIGYVHYIFLYGLPGKEQELEAIADEFVELYRDKGIDTGWSFYKSLTGSDLPLYVVAHGAKDEADYYANRERLKKLIGEEAEKIGKKVGATIRRMEFKDGYPRPDLSYPQPPEATSKKAAH